LFLDADFPAKKEIALSTHDLNDSTIAIHGGRTLDSHASSILFPLYQTSTFVHDAVGVNKGFSYSLRHRCW
jgi:cystathionine gamma-lyase